MKAVIVGGGKVGYNLLKTLKEKHYNVVLIERNLDVCNLIAEEFNGDVIHGDGTDLEVLRDAEIEDAQLVAAVTGKDEENLVICQIASKKFNVSKTISRINNPKNISVFKTLGVNNTVCSTEVIANLIEWELSMDRIKVIKTFENGEVVLVEAILEGKNSWEDKKVEDLKIPEDCVIVTIFREDKTIYPKVSTTIRKDDRILIVTNIQGTEELKKSIFGR